MKKYAFLALVLVIGMSSVVNAETKGLNLSGLVINDAVMVSDRDFNSDVPDTAAFLHTQANLKAVADLTSNVTGVIELETAVVTGGMPAAMVGGAGATLQLEQAYIEAKEAFRKELTLKAGIFDVVYDLRGNGDAFLLDLKRNATFRDQQVGGWFARWEQKPVTVDGFMLTLADAGTVNTNVSLLGAVVDYEKEKNLFRAAVLYGRYEDGNLAVPFGVDGSWFQLGLGADYFVLNGDLELYGEFGFQAGTAAKANPDIDHSGLALYLGARYNFKVNYKPWIDLSFWYLSGDDPASATDADGWFNLGHLNQTLIVENQEYGFGAGFNDNNYWTIRLEGGLAPTDNTTVMASFNMFTLVEVLAGADDAMGIEFDLKGTYAYTSDLSLALGFGVFMPDDGVTGGGAATDDPTFLINFETALKF